MILDVVGSVLQAAVALGDVRNEEMLHEALGIPIRVKYDDLLVKISGELNLTLQDLLIDRHRIIVIEGIYSSNHLVSEDSKRPPIDWLSVTLIEQDLWGQILRCATQSVGSCLAILCESKVSQFQVSFLIDQYVLWLQISVDYILLMQVFEHETDLGGVESIWSE